MQSIGPTIDSRATMVIALPDAGGLDCAPGGGREPDGVAPPEPELGDAEPGVSGPPDGPVVGV